VTAALLKSKDHFIPHALDGHVLYEPGAEKEAEAIADCLEAAAALVEREHGLPFRQPFTVYVCATQKAFNEFIAKPPGGLGRGASVLNRSVYIAPRAFSFGGLDTHREVLAHELSHLNMRQQLGYIRHLRNIPTWFNEGLANTIAGSGGEWIAEETAVAAILAGRHFAPDLEGRLPTPKSASDYGMEYPMFHKQTKMFVTYLRDRNEPAFRAFLLDIQRGEPFAKTFSERFGTDVYGMWNAFVTDLEG
jgi:hypothetical protein